jgi:D-alanyl-D-alanine carboxypeptidase
MELKTDRGTRMLATILRAMVLATGLGVLPAWAGPALLFDAGTGKVLYSEDQDNQWHPASLTKIMTAYVVFEALKAGKVMPETKIGCSELANSQPPSKVGLPVGAEMTVETALQALIVKSANDVAVMLAEAVAGSQDAFVEKMNATAARLGMTRTKFVNANGLPAPEQVTTARDLAKLSLAVVKDYPEYAPLWAMMDVRIGNRHLRTHNGLLANYEGADGLKTGFICDSGFNVVASATREGKRMIAVVLGEATGRERAMRAASLLEHGFQTHGWKALFATQSLDSLPMAEDAKGPMTMRQAVVSYECGTRKRRPVAKVHKRKATASADAVPAEMAKPDKKAPAPVGKAAKPDKAAASAGSRAQ